MCKLYICVYAYIISILWTYIVYVFIPKPTCVLYLHCMHVYMYIFMYVYTYIDKYIIYYVCTYTYIYVYVSLCRLPCVLLYMHVYYIWVPTYIIIHVCMCIYSMCMYI